MFTTTLHVFASSYYLPVLLLTRACHGQVKKKWSLRSISFSRKDKPKQEKKQKDEEPKTNGEPEKVPEEVNIIYFFIK